MALSSGTPIAAIARLVAADEDTVRDVTYAFTERRAPPRIVRDDDVAVGFTTATTCPTVVGAPFTRWSVRSLAVHLGTSGYERPLLLSLRIVEVFDSLLVL